MRSGVAAARSAIAVMALSAMGYVSITKQEDFRAPAYMPTPNDVPTYGFGTTTHEDGSPVRMGEKITVTAALERSLVDIRKFEGALKKCVTVPLHQYEYDAYISLAYNIGSGAFCGSTLVVKLNAGDYEGACLEIKRWNRQGNKVLPGLVKRRQDEYEQCIGKRNDA